MIPTKPNPSTVTSAEHTSKQKEEINKIIKTKQPSLPYLPKKQKEFYNKWYTSLQFYSYQVLRLYIPYDQRYLQKPDVVEQQYQDELHFYKNMHNMYVLLPQFWTRISHNMTTIQYNPFDQKLPDDLIKKIGYKERTEALKEILKGQKQIIEFKRNLEKERQRVPEFIKQLVDSDKKKQKKKSYS